MEIIVLLKRVPATESMIGVAGDGKSIKTDDLKWVVNPYDEFAVEEALRIKQELGGTVTVLSMGTDKAVESIRTALAMGADKGILINDPAALNCDSLGTARALAAAIKTVPYDLIIAGMRAVDEDNYQVGPAVAEYLDIPHISMVIKEEISDGKITCHRTVEGGTFVVEASLPALFTTQRGLNEPRYASLPGIMKAKKKPLEIKTLKDIGLNTEDVVKPRTRIVGMRFPPERAAGKIIEGESAGAKAATLVKILTEEARVL
ncbi:MAG: electron transfer flavoprotein subunit beta/FixA family protein [Desulfobacterales bacterium]|nr:electron transfer flavoprotein subunit beta/FixA family protein [Desulfobacterales bacterium]